MFPLGIAIATIAFFAGAGASQNSQQAKAQMVNFAPPCKQHSQFVSPLDQATGGTGGGGGCTGQGVPCNSVCVADEGGGSHNVIPIQADLWQTGTQTHVTCQQHVWFPPNNNCSGKYDATNPANPVVVCPW